jgi:hypothetical protein
MPGTDTPSNEVLPQYLRHLKPLDEGFEHLDQWLMSQVTSSESNIAALAAIGLIEEIETTGELGKAFQFWNSECGTSRSPIDDINKFRVVVARNFFQVGLLDFLAARPTKH